MAIEIVQMSRTRGSRWAMALFVFCIIIFLILSASYFYFYMTSEKISKEIQEKKRILAQTPPEKALEEELLLTETKINTFKGLLLNHQKVANVFSILEQFTHPQVLFSNFNFTNKEKAINVSGTAESFVVLEQQLIILKEAEIFKGLDLSGMTMDQEGRVGFSLKFSLDSEVLK